MTDDVDVGLQGSAEIKPERFSPLVSPPAVEQLIAPAPEEPDFDNTLANLERGVADLAEARAVLEPLVNPIVEAQQGADEAKQALEQAKAAAAEIEQLRTEEVQRERAADEQRQQRESEELAARQQYDDWARSQDAVYAARNPQASADASGIVEMLRAEGFTDETLQALWSGQGGVPLRSAAMQQMILDAYRYRNQPKAVPSVPRPVERQTPPSRLEQAQREFDRNPTARTGAALAAARRTR